MMGHGRKKMWILYSVVALTALPLVFYILTVYDPRTTTTTTATSYNHNSGGAEWLPPVTSSTDLLGGEGLLRSRHQFSSYDEYVQLQLKKTNDARLRKLWTSRDWRRKVDVFSGVFAQLIRSKVVQPGGKAKALCIGARVGQEVAALKENGVEDAIGIDLVPAPPLVIKGDIHRHPFPNDSFDLEFSNVFDHALFPALFVSEIERTLKPGGVAVIHLLLKGRGDKYSANDLLSLDPLLKLFRRSEVVQVREVDAFGLDTELVVRKQLNSSSRSCKGKVRQETIDAAEELIAVEPVKPWLTLKRNVKQIRYLPQLLEEEEGIGGRSGYVYVDVGSRNYASSIGSWFNKQYPKQGHNFSIFAIEADKSFHAAYASKAKSVTLLPYAAWTRNETLRFVNNKRNGMGRIVSSADLAVEGGGDVVVEEVQGFDLAEWLGATVRASDYVVMKMDVEGAEFELLPRLVESGRMCLVDELFLECHYNRWQKCCPGVRSPKYQHTYNNCLHLFRTLRASGLLVHQWW